MKLKTIKTEADVRAAASDIMHNRDEHIEAVIRDGSITEVRIGTLVITSTYGMTVSRMIEHEEAERHRVRVDHPAFASLNRYFEYVHEANEFRRPYDDINGAIVAEKKVKVLVDDTGKVVAELGDDGEAMPLVQQDDGGDDIPF